MDLTFYISLTFGEITHLPHHSYEAFFITLLLFSSIAVT